MGQSYNATVCDLCGSESVEEVLSTETEFCMSSDCKLMTGNLMKIVCGNCRLVRNGDDLDSKELLRRYQEEYFLGNENHFYTKNGPLPRAKVFASWILEAFGAAMWQSVKRCLEVGASDGSLLAEFRELFPDKSFEALELNEAGAKSCRLQGFKTHCCTLSDLDAGEFDVIYSIAVLEHALSPTEFLREARRRLRRDGLLIICQPTQDVYSHDIFFVDHIYHFGTEHIREYARKCGFIELTSVVGHAIVPGFSLHLWKKSDSAEDYAWRSSSGGSKCQESFQRIMKDIRELNARLRHFKESEQKMAVFGVNELFFLLYVYSELRSFPIACGLDDHPDKAAYKRFKFPVVRPEACTQYGVEGVLLTMNKAHYEYARERIEKMGLKAYEIFH